jgi:hypothetical protein
MNILKLIFGKKDDNKKIKNNINSNDFIYGSVAPAFFLEEKPQTD